MVGMTISVSWVKSLESQIRPKHVSANDSRTLTKEYGTNRNFGHDEQGVLERQHFSQQQRNQDAVRAHHLHHADDDDGRHHTAGHQHLETVDQLDSLHSH